MRRRPLAQDDDAADPVGAVKAAYERIAASGRPEVWVSVLPQEVALAAAEGVAGRLERGEHLPLAGRTVAVKDNIDVAGAPTTAGCPAFSRTAAVSATVVDRLVGAGAVVVGKANLDQFATGLVGTRSPYGAVASARDPERVGGGSSSGSALAVALGLVDLALGTDTAGSGRVPAAFNGIVGLKPSRGLLPATGLVPACRSLDCVSTFAATVALAADGLRAMAGLDGVDPFGRATPADAPLADDPRGRIAVPDATALRGLSPARRSAFSAAVEHVAGLGHPVDEIPFDLFERAAGMVYGSALVAERHAAVGRFVDDHPDEVDPVVGGIIAAAGRIRAARLVHDLEEVAALRIAARALLGRRLLLTPTVEVHPTLAEVAADPLALNTRLGRFASHCNVLDLCAAAVPAGDVDGLPHGITAFGPAFSDDAVLSFAARLGGEPAPAPLVERGVLLVVAGAHLRGQPLNVQLTAAGARFEEQTTTAATYRLHALATDPPKPGLVRVASGGVPLEVEVWRLPEAGFATFVADVPPPLAIGSVALHDGRVLPGFVCEPAALDGAVDISASGGWRAHLAGPGRP